MLFIFGLPSFLSYTPPEEPAAITVEILPITGVTNVKPMESTPTEAEKPEEKPQEKPEPKEPEKAEDQKKPTPPVKTAEETPPPPPAEKPDVKTKEKPKDKKEEEKKKEEKKKPKEEDLTAVLKAVRDTAAKEKKSEKTDNKDSGSKSKSISNSYDPTLPLSLSEKDAIRSQIAKCWSVPAGAKDAHELIVILRLQLERDGSVIKVELANESKSRYSRDTFFRAAADSAMRAVRQCSPLQNLPADKFNTWRDIELTFDPKEMLF